MAEGPSVSEPHETDQPASSQLVPQAYEPPASRSNPPGAAEEPLPDLEGRLLGEFRLIRRIGRGGMAEVFLAEQTSLNRHVAVKVLRHDLVTDETYLKRFRTEALAAAGLNHPNIVQVYVVGDTTDGTHYIAQEYVQGQNLRESIVRKGPPEAPEALHLMKQVAAALQAAAAAGIVHRDIKPENILLTRKGEVKVADFGLAQLTQQGERLNLTQEGTTMGTPLYMSPEQVSGSKLDQRSDIYSFGVTCYHLLTGTPPFRGDTAIAVALQHLQGSPPPLEQSRPDLPPLLCRIVHKMMSKKPEDRYPEAQAILADLERVEQEGMNPASRPSEVSQRPAPAVLSVGTWKRTLDRLWHAADAAPQRQLQYFALAAVCCALLGAGWGWARRPQNPLNAARLAQTVVPDKGTAAAQFFYAMNVNDEAAWKAVEKYYPNDRLECQRASQQLAMMYLSQSRNQDALEIFDQFAAHETGDAERAFGLAGQASIYTRLKDEPAAEQSLEKLKPLYGRLDERMQQVVRDAVIRLHGRSPTDWDEIFRRSITPPTPRGENRRGSA